MNYHGTVDGKIFDSSVDKDWLKTQKRKAEPIVFKVIQSARSLSTLCERIWYREKVNIVDDFLGALGRLGRG